MGPTNRAVRKETSPLPQPTSRTRIPGSIPAPRKNCTVEGSAGLAWCSNSSGGRDARAHSVVLFPGSMCSSTIRGYSPQIWPVAKQGVGYLGSCKFIRVRALSPIDGKPLKVGVHKVLLNVQNSRNGPAWPLMSVFLNLFQVGSNLFRSPLVLRRVSLGSLLPSPASFPHFPSGAGRFCDGSLLILGHLRPMRTAVFPCDHKPRSIYDPSQRKRSTGTASTEHLKRSQVYGKRRLTGSIAYRLSDRNRSPRFRYTSKHASPVPNKTTDSGSGIVFSVPVPRCQEDILSKVPNAATGQCSAV